MEAKVLRDAVIGAVLTAAVGSGVWYFGFDNLGPPSPSIDGPSTVYVTKTPGLPGVVSPTFYLRGHADGGYRQMYWTDTFGTTVPFAGDGVSPPFHCPDVGTFTIKLTEVNREGRRGSASQTVDCVAR